MSDLQITVMNSFQEFITKYGLCLSVDTSGGWMHESVVLEGNSAALSFEKDNMSDAFYVNWLLKENGILPNPLMFKRIINTDYVGVVIGWPKRESNTMDVVIEWVRSGVRTDAEMIFSPSDELINRALEEQLRDQ
jgi:hypothetical protein